MLLAIDIGNTTISLGIFKAERLVASWRMKTRLDTTAEAYGKKIFGLFDRSGYKPRAIQAAALASVVPRLTPLFEALVLSRFHCPCYTIKPDHGGVKIASDNPKEVGADRVVNVAAAYALVGGPAIVVDFGTATTFDCCGVNGEYLGGAIAPGPLLAAGALARHTARLPMVKMNKPKSVLGRNTIACLQSGLFYGYLGLVKEILGGLVREMGGRPAIIATGGQAPVVAKDLPLIHRVIPDLTLQGIRIIWEKQKKKKRK